MLVAALLALAPGAVLAALTSSIVVMIVARVMQGIGGGVLPLSFGIIRDEFPVEKGGWRRRRDRGAGREKLDQLITQR